MRWVSLIALVCLLMPVLTRYQSMAVYGENVQQTSKEKRTTVSDRVGTDLLYEDGQDPEDIERQKMEAVNPAETEQQTTNKGDPEDTELQQEEKIAQYTAMSQEQVTETLDAGGTYTRSELEAMGVDVLDQATGKIPASYFAYYIDSRNTEADEANYVPAETLLTEEADKAQISVPIQQGKLDLHVPQELKCSAHEETHKYQRAIVDGVSVYYVGILRVYEQDGQPQPYKDYVYYSATDEALGQKLAAYTVLAENEKIRLYYSPSHGIPVTYEIKQDEEQAKTADDAYPYTLDETFGSDRIQSVKKGNDFVIEVEIPRGYTADVKITGGSEDTAERWERGIGNMPVYNENADPVTGDVLVKAPPTAEQAYLYPAKLDRTRKITVENVQSTHVNVTLIYRKIETYQFSTHAVLQTRYFGDTYNGTRKQRGVATPETGSFTGTTFSWEMQNQITTSSGTNYIWEIDSLQINGEELKIAFVADSESQGTTRSEETVLSSGTIVKMTVTKGAQVPRNQIVNTRNGYYRSYKFEVTNCYESLTVTGGNMISHTHQEIIPETLTGVNAVFWGKSGGTNGYYEVSKSTPIATHSKNGGGNGYFFDEGRRFRVGFETGYLGADQDVKPKITIRTTDGVDRTKDLLKDTGTNLGWGWKDGIKWYYFEITDPKNKGLDHRILLLSIEAEPMKFALVYDKGDVGHATGMPDPTYDDGGEQGYNLLNNSVIRLSPLVPNDASSAGVDAGRMIFDCWRPLNTDGNVFEGEEHRLNPGGSIDLKSFPDDLLKYAKYNNDTGRYDLTIRATWKDPAVPKPPITYRVWYYLNGIRVRGVEETATVPEGGTIRSSLYSGKPATADNPYANYSPALQNFLNSDYLTEQQKKEKWRLDEKKTEAQIQGVTADNNLIEIHFYSSVDVDVDKEWEHGSQELPPELKVTLVGTYLDMNGETHTVELDPGISTVALNEQNQWKYTWTGLHKYYEDNALFPVHWAVRELAWVAGSEGGTGVIGDKVEDGELYEGYQASYTLDDSDPGHPRIHIKNTLVYSLTVVKQSQATTGSEPIPLKGAGFRLYVDEACTTAANVYYDPQLKQSVTEENIPEHLTGEDGTLTFYGLKTGTFYLKEIRTPAGYELLKTPIPIVIAKDGSITASGQAVTAEGAQIRIEVTNIAQNLSYPKAGGRGIYFFQLAGIILMAAAAMMLWRQHRTVAESRTAINKRQRD